MSRLLQDRVYARRRYRQEGRRTLELLWSSILNICRHGPPCMILKIRSPDELERSTGNIMASGVLGYWTSYELCSLDMRSKGVVLSSFLHLCVKLQMSTYLKEKALRLHRTGQSELLSSSFRMAATENEVVHQGFEKKHANHHLNETFLGLGYNPSQRLNTCQAPPNTWTDTEPMVIRKFVI